MHQHGPEITLPSSRPLFALSSWFRMEPNDEMESKSTDIPPLRWQVKIGFGTKPIQFRRTISTMVAQLGGGFYVGIIYRSKAFMENGVGGEGETGRIDVKSSGDLRRNGGGGSANRLLPIRPNTGSTNPRRGLRRIFEFSIPGNSSGIVNGSASPRLNLCQV